MPDLAATITDVTETTANGRGRADLPVRRITANQVVAWNLARYRRAAGLKQDELGELLGWRRGAVSDAERSWKGGRVREFDAHALTVISLALGIPVIALLLPPDGEGAEEYWEIDGGPERGPLGMADYLTDVIIPDGPVEEDDNPALEEYDLRYARSADAYIPDAAARARAMLWLRRAYSRDELADFAAFLRRQQAAAADMAAWAAGVAGAVENDLEAEGE